MAAPRHVFETYIRATPEAIWAAITDPTFTRRTSTARRSRARSRPGDAVRYVLPDGDDAVTGVVEEVDPPRRLVMTWRVLYDPSSPRSRRAGWSGWSTPGVDGVTRVTTIHRDLALSPGTSTMSVTAGRGSSTR